MKAEVVVVRCSSSQFGRVGDQARASASATCSGGAGCGLTEPGTSFEGQGRVEGKV